MLGNTKTGPAGLASIFVEDNTLMLKLAGAPVGFPLLAESETQFFHPAQDIMIVFIKNANGQVVEVTLRLNGREFHAKKIK